jgi:cytochrome c oxidase subunit III
VTAASITGATAWKTPSRGRLGIFCLILAESMIFASFIIAYIFYMGKSLGGPTPQQVLPVPIFITACLLTSSLTIRSAIAALRKGNAAVFGFLWFFTFALGAIFIIGTAREWRHLIYEENFTIRTNLFGATYYSLIGLHASHVIVGLVALAVVMILTLLGKINPEHWDRCYLLSLYWHFVDAAWVAVLTVVYVVGR